MKVQTFLLGFLQQLSHCDPHILISELPTFVEAPFEIEQTLVSLRAFSRPLETF